MKERLGLSTIVNLTKDDYINVKKLFGQVPFGWDVFLESALDYGFILADDRQNPQVALAFIGGCIIYSGDSTHESAVDLVKAQSVQPAVLAYSEPWADLVKEVYGHKVNSKMRYYFPYKALNEEILYNISLDIPKGYKIQKMNMDMVDRLEELGEVYYKYHYTDLQDFINRGCCFCITKGDEICAAVGAFLRADDKIQVQVNTKEVYRRQGFATIVSAYMLRYCIEHDIEVVWDSANIISRELAKKLGYEECIPYEVLEYFPE